MNKLFEYNKSLMIGIIIGFILGSTIIGLSLYRYFNNNYVQLHKVDIGYFLFKDNHAYQLQQLVDESLLYHDAKKPK